MNKKLFIEQRNDALEKMEALKASVATENRAFTAEEIETFNGLKDTIEMLDATIEALDYMKEPMAPAPADNAETREIKAFENYLRGINNASENVTKGDNGALVPSTIANKIIDKVMDISPLYQLAERYNIKGALTIPYVNQATTTLGMTYATEFVTPPATTVKTGSIELTGFIGETLVKISKSLINNSQFDIISFIIDKVAKDIANWIDRELLAGTNGKITGLSTATQVVTAASATAITADELIDLQEEVPDAYQSGAIWIMNRATRKAIRKLKDGQGNFLLERDFTAKWGYTLLGKPVYTSDNMPVPAAGKSAIYYGDMTGLAVKVSEDININTLNELYITEHAVGVVAFVELDAKIQDENKIAVLKMKNA